MWFLGLPPRAQAVFDAYAGLFPACAAGIFDQERVFFAVSGTALHPRRGQVPADERTAFDLASLTKALAAAPAAFLLRQRGLLRLEASLPCPLPLARPELAQHLERTTVAQLLNHSSGLPAYAPFFENAAGLDDMRTQLGHVLPQAAPGERFLYSDIGYIFLGMHLSSLSGGDWTVWAIKNLLDGDFSFWKPPAEAAWADNREPGNSAMGVHDENARLLGAHCAHAGLFGSLQDVIGWLQCLCRIHAGLQRHPLSLESVRQMWTPLAPEDPFTCGFDRPAAAGFTTAGQNADRRAVVGHLGFSGTAFWVHPGRFRGGVLLTNRVALGRHARMEELKRFRAAFFDEVWQFS